MAKPSPSYIAELAAFVSVLRSGASPQAAAAFIMASKFQCVLSHCVEDKAHDGTYAAAVFAILCGEA